MKIFLNIEADTAEELGDALGRLAAVGTLKDLTMRFDPATVAAVADDKANPPPAAEPVKRGRKPKAEPEQSKEPPAPAAEAKPTDPAPQNTAGSPGGEAASSSTVAATDDEPPAITAEEVKNQIIDLLNDWSEAKPDDAEIRVKVLAPMLDRLGASGKISTIPPENYRLVPALIDESRAELEAYTGGGNAED